jgi:hypothetical protein
MYKVQINIADWDFMDDEILTIETSDFEKVQIIQEFIEFQKEYGWAVDYDVTDEFIAAQFDDAGIEFDDEDEEYVYDEDTDAWYWYDEEADVWYVYDEESDDWVEYVEDEESEDEESEDEESEDEESKDEAPTITSYVITRV